MQVGKGHWRIQRTFFVRFFGGEASFGEGDLTYPHFELYPRI